ncbi:MAG: Hsp20/alpha crystallin family protein [Acidimicrobiia bacterium]|nr:Hsp20/alpha crystallin family protein [Acidimicrobiia bacterium]
MARFVDPFEEMDRMLARTGNRWRGGVMPLDAYEKDGEYVLRFDLPGVDSDKIEVMVEDKVLTVKAERSMEDTVGANWMLRERPTGINSRQVRLGESLDATNVSADLDSGILTVVIPIKEEAKPQKIEITSGQRQALEASSV